MALNEMQLAKEMSESKLGKYDIVKLALDWISVKKQDEDYRHLTQADLIVKALNDVVENVATPEKIEELRKKMKAKENKAAETAEKV